VRGDVNLRNGVYLDGGRQAWRLSGVFGRAASGIVRQSLVLLRWALLEHLDRALQGTPPAPPSSTAPGDDHVCRARSRSAGANPLPRGFPARHGDQGLNSAEPAPVSCRGGSHLSMISGASRSWLRGAPQAPRAENRAAGRTRAL